VSTYLFIIAISFKSLQTSLHVGQRLVLMPPAIMYSVVASGLKLW